MVGSAARGERGDGSDIDYAAPPASIPYFDGVVGDLPDIDPDHGIVPGSQIIQDGPAIRFEPGAKPRFIPRED